MNSGRLFQGRCAGSRKGPNSPKASVPPLIRKRRFPGRNLFCPLDAGSGVGGDPDGMQAPGACLQVIDPPRGETIRGQARMRRRIAPVEIKGASARVKTGGPGQAAVGEVLCLQLGQAERDQTDQRPVLGAKCPTVVLPWCPWATQTCPRESTTRLWELGPPRSWGRTRPWL